jgi:hypothetical protein
MEQSRESKYLWVSLDPIHGLLFSLTIPRRELRLQGLLLLLLNLPRILTALVMLGRFSAHVETLVVLTHGKVSLSLPQVRANEAGVPLDGIVAILHSGWEAKQLDVACGSVGVAAWVLRSAFDHLGVGFYSCGPVCLLELLIAEFAGLFCLCRVNVGVSFHGDLRLLSSTELGEDIWGAMLRQGALVVVDGVWKVSQLLV